MSFYYYSFPTDEGTPATGGGFPSAEGGIDRVSDTLLAPKALTLDRRTHQGHDGAKSLSLGAQSPGASVSTSCDRTGSDCH